MREHNSTAGRLSPPSVTERAMRYLAVCDPAISGAGGHKITFRVACTLLHGFCLSPTRDLGLLKIYNEKCEPPWSDAELRHKIVSAAGTVSSKGRAYASSNSKGLLRQVLEKAIDTDAVHDVRSSLSDYTVLSPQLDPYRLDLPEGHRNQRLVCRGRQREMKLSWAREIRDQCQNAGVRFFFKQVSGRHPQETEIPTDLFIREFPVEGNRTIYG